MKLCTHCGTEKPLSEFYTKGKGKHGPLLQSWCIPCLNGHKKAKNYYYTPVRVKRAEVDLSLNRYLWRVA